MNPFTKDMEALQRQYRETGSEQAHWKAELAWFQGFSFDNAAANLKQVRCLESEAQVRLGEAQRSVRGLEASIERLKPRTDLGINPRHWFSSERAIAKRQLSTVRQELKVHQSRADKARIELSKVAELGRNGQEHIAKARTFDPLLAQSAIAALQKNLDRIEPELASLRQRSNDLDALLREPLENLQLQEAARAQIMEQISRAEAFDMELTNADNGREKHQIHARCEEELGISKPGIVLSKCRGTLRGMDENIRKLRGRIERLIRFAVLDIRHIVIDGNNLCYEGRHFLGLAALEALIPLLAKKHRITVIFDASIRHKMGLGDRDIEGRFPKAERVHIVASKRTADETVLSEANSDPHTLVLSNDRFAEYPEKSAVKEKRILRHEIVGRNAYIHDLQLETTF